METLKIEMMYDSTTGYQVASKDSFGNSVSYEYDQVGHLFEMFLPPEKSGASRRHRHIVYQPYDPVTIDSCIFTVTGGPSYFTGYCNTANHPDLVSNGEFWCEIQYNAINQISTITNELSLPPCTLITYDDISHNIAKMKTPENNDLVFDYNANGFIVSISTYEGDSVGGTLVDMLLISMDHLNRTSSVHSSTTGLSSTLIYNPNGAILSTTTEYECTTTFCYTDSSSEIMPAKVIHTSPSISNGSFYLPNSSQIINSVIQYTPCPYSITDKDGYETKLTYKDNGLPYTVTDHKTLVTTYSYDQFDRLSSITDPYGQETEYAYDLNSRITAIMNEWKGTVSYTYDNLGQVTNLEDPVKGSLEFTYFDDGLPKNNENGQHEMSRFLRKPGPFEYINTDTEILDYHPIGQLERFENTTIYRNCNNKITDWNHAINGNASFDYSGINGSMH